MINLDLPPGVTQTFIAKTVEVILETGPNADEIILHGSRTINTARRKSDWDFLVVIPDDTPASDFPDFHRIGDMDWKGVTRFRRRRIDIQPTKNSFGSAILAIARKEGFALWCRLNGNVRKDIP